MLLKVKNELLSQLPRKLVINLMRWIFGFVRKLVINLMKWMLAMLVDFAHLVFCLSHLHMENLIEHLREAKKEMKQLTPIG